MLILWTAYTFAFMSILTSIDGQSTTAASFVKDDSNRNRFKYPRSKYYYFYTPRSQVRDLIGQSSRPETELIEDRNYDSYEGYQAQWPAMPTKMVHQPPPPPIHVYTQLPAQQHKEKDDKTYYLPLLLLALLPLLLGSLILLPLLFSFLTNVLQLLAMLQQTIANLNNNATNANGRRRRSDRDVNPIILTTLSTLFDRYVSSQQKFATIN